MRDAVGVLEGNGVDGGVGDIISLGGDADAGPSGLNHSMIRLLEFLSPKRERVDGDLRHFSHMGRPMHNPSMNRNFYIQFIYFLLKITVDLYYLEVVIFLESRPSMEGYLI